jgi:hypothetical protein
MRMRGAGGRDGHVRQGLDPNTPPDSLPSTRHACTRAGAEIIAENLTRRGDVGPMVPGRKAVAVFGFCDIRRFTDTTEILQVRACMHAWMCWGR